jgi:ribosomal silencing factor RsfS
MSSCWISRASPAYRLLRDCDRAERAHMRAHGQSGRGAREPGIHSTHVEGEADSGWVLLDFSDVIVHLFTPADRVYYNLEGLWGRGRRAPVRFQ